MDRVERRLHPGLELQAGGVLVPAVQQAVERAEQEVARPAGRVDEPEALQRPFLQRRFQRAVEDELLHEDRRLQQRVGVLGVLGQVLVQVAEEPGGQRRVRQVVDERAVLAAVAPEVEQPGDRVTGRRDEVQRRMRVDQRLRRGQPARWSIAPEPLAVGVLGVGAEERELGVERFLPAVLRPGDPDRPDQRVVLAEPDEHAGQHPRDRRLGDPVVAPGDPGRRRALLIQGPLVLLLPAALQVSVGCDPGAQVVLQEQDLPLQVRGEGGCRGHRVPSAAEDGRDGNRSTRRRGGRTARGRRAAGAACR